MLCEDVNINANDSVLDVACGNGRLLHMLSEKEKFSGYGVDISENMIEQARKLNPDMKFYVSGCEKLPFSLGEIDIMTVCAAYHHFPDVDAFAKEACRVIKNNGMLYIAEINLPSIIRYICNPLIKFSKAGDVKIYSSKEIVELFESNGFRVKGIKISGIVQLIILQKI